MINAKIKKERERDKREIMCQRDGQIERKRVLARNASVSKTFSHLLQ